MNVSVINATFPDSGSIKINSDVDGEYKVFIANNTYTVNVVNGTGNVTVDKLTPNLYNVTVQSSVKNYESVSISSKMSIETNNKTSIVAKNLTRPYDSEYDFEATFLDDYGNPLIDGEVEFSINNET